MERQTEHVNLVAIMVIFHEELVTLHDVLVKTSSEHQVENPSSLMNNWRDARLKVCPDTCPYHAQLA
jgi:hypothetical protein